MTTPARKTINIQHVCLPHTSDCFSSVQGDRAGGDDVILGDASNVGSSDTSISSASSSYVPDLRRVGLCCAESDDDVTAGSECVDDVMSASSC